MLNRITYVPFGTRRALPLRNVQFSYATAGTSTLRGNTIWFTPEAIITDALSVLTDTLFIWQIFRKAVPTFAFRTAALAILMFLILGLNQRPEVAVAGNYKAETPKPTIDRVILTTNIVAREHPIFSWPIRGGITTMFSSYHKGIDISSSYGTPIHPFASGTVLFASWDNHGFGNAIIIRSAAGYDSKYGHLSALNVKVGQRVESDSVIGFIGATGVATGPHLHFEVYKDGVAINPLGVLP
jgi:murein DD-endopeptidase MepM/ murein hydrolase activator NlpD